MASIAVFLLKSILDLDFSHQIDFISLIACAIGFNSALNRHCLCEILLITRFINDFVLFFRFDISIFNRFLSCRFFYSI